jgi:hypothetical protein
LQKVVKQHAFCKNWLSNGHTFLEGIDELLRVLSVFLDCCGLNSAFMGYKKKICALGVHEIFASIFY